MPTTGDKLLVIGAGPKGIALAAKAHVLETLGWAVPELVLVDQLGLAGHWSGTSGYTDGRQPLGTPPEKDIGFPYASDSWGGDGRDVDCRMLAFSWQAHLVATRTGRELPFAEWLDRGRPQPRHREWGAYLAWVANAIGVSCRTDTVEQIGLDGGEWLLRLSSGEEVRGAGLVITGPGPPKQQLDVTADSDCFSNGADFWPRIDELTGRFTAPGTRACVIGSGETAAAVAVVLHERLPPDSAIDVVSRQGVVYSRGESYEENRLFSDPSRWRELDDDNQQEFIRRTDRGVFSMASKSVLNEARGVQTLAGNVTKVEPREGGILVHRENKDAVPLYDIVVDATGFSAAWFLDLLDKPAREAVIEVAGEATPAALENVIASDLALGEHTPRLHLPMFAALRQGPGFPNLSSLGLLSDRILRPYCQEREEA